MVSAELFRNFLTIYREGSVSAAARSRHLTQSAVELPNSRRFWQPVLGLRLETQLRFVVPDLPTVVDAVEQGFGVIIVPDFLTVPPTPHHRVFKPRPTK